MQFSCSNCQVQIEADTSQDSVCPFCGQAFTATAAAGAATAATSVRREPASATPQAEDGIPARLGRIRILGRVGSGGFATVFKGYDDELARDVAAKVLHRTLLASPKVLDAFLNEAKILARLEHPGIVPIYDIGRTDDNLNYLVTKWVDGGDLKTRMQKSRLSIDETADIVATIAEALHHAHAHGLVHRDVKPANILLDAESHPLLADFGLALRAEEYGKGPADVGTPLYMSPEQARKEGHLVDARTDIYSLGVVFYELLTGKHPFRGTTMDELLEFIRTQEAIPPRQLEPRVPQEFERIWRKATALRVSDRYSSAREFADDLRYWQSERLDKSTRRPGGLETSRQRSVLAPHVVPRGLRSFDVVDAGFFLDLLPGARNRDGLPESISFWKTRLDNTRAEETFRVGLLYGPSGCGKSSLVKAGLMPRLGQHVSCIFVEANADQTEVRLLQELRRYFPSLPTDLGPAETLARLRAGDELPEGKKVVMVFDQFEQWLQAPRSASNLALTEALRQCDGARVQALLLVRDDYWLAVSRFMRDLEVSLQEGQNTTLVDLFDPFHARKVLAALGVAFGRLPESKAEYTPAQNQFLDQAVAELAEGGKIIPVRLTLFAEMVKGKAWTPATLEEVGGIEGTGVVFLEETFVASTAPAGYRLHRKAAAAVLRTLLPDASEKIKGGMRAREELVEASGYARRPKAFAELLRILDQELRLVTPVVGRLLPGDWSLSQSVGPEANAQFYQLSHDYLVPALRQWLTLHQREQHRGRAELRLAERANEWNLGRENRRLPAWWEWINILLFTRPRRWTEPQRKMMQQANRYHATRTAVWAALIALLAVAGAGVHFQVQEERGVAHADRVVAEITNFHSDRLKSFRVEVQRNPRLIPKIQSFIDDPSTSVDDRTHARMVLLDVDPGQVAPLTESLLSAEPRDLVEVREALAAHRDEVVPSLWARVDDPQVASGARLRAACALVHLDPDSPRWADVGGPIVKQLMEQNISNLGEWLKAFAPVRQALEAPLTRLFADAAHPDKQLLAAEALAFLAADKLDTLTDLILQATPAQYKQLWPVFAAHRSTVLPRLEREWQSAPAGDRAAGSKRRAQALITLMRLGQPDAVWPLLRHTPDPEQRSFLIHLFDPLGADPFLLFARYEHEADVSARRALLLSIGSFAPERVSASLRQQWTPRIVAYYRDDADAGIHAAAEWLLRRWGQDKELTRLAKELSGAGPTDRRHWFVNGQGQTLVILPAPGEVLVGSPPDEPGRHSDETRHRVFLGKPFAIGACNVTVEQFQRFLKAHPELRYRTPEEYAPDAACPVLNVSWYQAAQYCRWLSEQEGIAEEQMCYPPVADIKDGMKLPADFLTRSGYRLPTGPEWEYACRAGAETMRYYGSTEELLGNYAWYFANSQDRSWPVGSLKPNDFGLFDMHGNAWTWCQNRFRLNEAKSEEAGDVVINNLELRALRGGSFRRRPFLIRAAARIGEPPVMQDYAIGLRVVRTWK